jgi:hypothetical protein
MAVLSSQVRDRWRVTVRALQKYNRPSAPDRAAGHDVVVPGGRRTDLA